MSNWDHDDHYRGGPEERAPRGQGDWRRDRDWRAGPGEARRPNPADERGSRALREDVRGERFRLERDDRRGGGERPADYNPEVTPYTPGGGASRGYGEGGDTSYGQMASGSSGSGLGGYSGADVGGWGQPTLNSQWGQGGYGPLNQGIDYGQDGGRFGPAGYNSGFEPLTGGRDRPAGPRDEHHAHYTRWRDAQLSSHDRDYNRWRDEQARRYDEDYGAWRNERHDVFRREFEGWRSGRGGQAVPPATAQAGSAVAGGSTATVSPSERSVYGSAAGEEGSAHGANPTLARIADGEAGHRPHHQKGDDEAS